ncbi:MAG: hypothetical protein GC202_13125 [Alphaproteobacteria bacterium]|nr:hypothetical protein [Alphaproteobacteria bacterium]
MTDLTNAVAVLGRPYAITRSRLGAITKVYSDRYICDVPALKELFNSMDEKLRGITNVTGQAFSFLISFADQTHHDGVTADLMSMSQIPIGKVTERVVVKWSVVHEIDGAPNDLSVTIRVSNPVNPLIFLQAALSRSAAELDNFEFELGSTCVTVDGANQAFADEVFLRVKRWLEARSKPHSFMPLHKIYKRWEWAFDQLSISLLPLIVAVTASAWLWKQKDTSLQASLIPSIFAGLIVIQMLGARLNMKMAKWVRKTNTFHLFQITNGDCDSLTRQVAQANSNALKFFLSAAFAFLLNLAAGIVCWWMLPSGT